MAVIGPASQPNFSPYPLLFPSLSSSVDPMGTPEKPFCKLTSVTVPASRRNQPVTTGNQITQNRKHSRHGCYGRGKKTQSKVHTTVEGHTHCGDSGSPFAATSQQCVHQCISKLISPPLRFFFWKMRITRVLISECCNEEQMSHWGESHHTALTLC